MDAFYAAAAKVLKPGGTLAMFTCSSMYARKCLSHYWTLIHDISLTNVSRDRASFVSKLTPSLDPTDPHHKELQQILSRLEDDMLGSYVLPGNMLSRNMYKDLPLPWSLSQPNKHFDQTSFKRQDWDAHGVPSATALEDGTPGPFLFVDSTSPEQLGRAFGSASMVIRWREANKEALARGDIEDCVDVTVKDLKAVLKDRSDGTFVTGPSCTLLLMKRA